MGYVESQKLIFCDQPLCEQRVDARMQNHGDRRLAWVIAVSEEIAFAPLRAADVRAT